MRPSENSLLLLITKFTATTMFEGRLCCAISLVWYFAKNHKKVPIVGFPISNLRENLRAGN